MPRRGLGGCRGSVIGAHDADRRGVCYWCGERVEPPVPAPEHYPVSELTEAYAYFYDPDEAVDLPAAAYLNGRAVRFWSVWPRPLRVRDDVPSELEVGPDVVA